jgi:SAM-dependent methyltransferase
MRQATNLVRAANEKWSNLSYAVRRARREDGLTAASRLATRWVVEGMARPVTEFRQHRLDRRLGIETVREPEVGAEVVSAARYVDGNYYMPAPPDQFTKMLRSLPIDTPHDFTFVDFGCGKGLTLLLAAAHGFQPVVGVELDSRLVAVARENVQAFAANSLRHAAVIDVIHKDGADYELPARPAVAFLFNPFGAATLRVVVDSMERSLMRTPRPFFVAYYNPVHREIFDECPLLRRLSATTRWVLYEATRRG